MSDDIWVKTMMDLVKEIYDILQAAELDEENRARIKKKYDEIEKNFRTFMDTYLDFRELSNHLYDGIHISDGTGRVVFVNDAYTKLTGIPLEEIYGRTVQDILEEGMLYRRAVTMDVIKTGKQVNLSGQAFRSGREVLVTGSPVFNEAGIIKFVVASDRDMSSLRDMEKQVSQMKAEGLKAEREINFLRNRQISNKKIVYKSTKMKAVLELIHTIAATDVTVLITGESGTGKELISDELYFSSNRRGKAFIKVNCAAIPGELLESELFGYEGGAFTDAKKKGKIGLLELADGGTVLLDEIGDMPIGLQTKMLRFLQEREIMRVGGGNPIKLDIRIIASTNKNIQKAVKEGEFREDLYYRLNVVPITILPLRERREDIPVLISEFLNCYNKKYAKQMEMESDAIKLLVDYSWPGNIRELENMIERMVVINRNGRIKAENVLLVLNTKQPTLMTIFAEGNTSLREAVRKMEKGIIIDCIKSVGSINKAAAKLGMSQPALCKKCKNLKINYKIVLGK